MNNNMKKINCNHPESIECKASPEVRKCAIADGAASM